MRWYSSLKPGALSSASRKRAFPSIPNVCRNTGKTGRTLDVTGAGLGLHLIKSYMDETSFVRKGRAGQEILLTKHMKNKHINNLMSDGEKSMPL